jgi:hypothetical protein
VLDYSFIFSDSSIVGHILNITRIRRDQMGTYMCVAENGIPPPKNQTFSVEVKCKFTRNVYNSCAHCALDLHSTEQHNTGNFISYQKGRTYATNTGLTSTSCTGQHCYKSVGGTYRGYPPSRALILSTNRAEFYKQICEFLCTTYGLSCVYCVINYIFDYHT